MVQRSASYRQKHAAGDRSNHVGSTNLNPVNLQRIDQKIGKNTDADCLAGNAGQK